MDKYRVEVSYVTEYSRLKEYTYVTVLPSEVKNWDRVVLAQAMRRLGKKPVCVFATKLGD